MDDKFIESCKRKLLDLGKKNNLINFKDNNNSLELISPSFYQAYNKLNSNNIIQIYDDKESTDIDVSREKDIEEYMNQHIKKLRQFQFLLFNKKFNTKNVLKNIYKKAEESILERGINTLYFSFGFVKYKEKDNNFYYAPIILVPVSITNEGPTKPYYIKLLEDEIIINLSLTYLLKKEYDIEIPEFDDLNPQLFINNLKEILAPLDFEVLEEARLSIFSFNKLNMYLDLDLNKEKILSNKNIIALAKNDYKLNEVERDNNKDLFLELHNVVDADYSQEEAIKYALSGNSFVLQGPPGTGKSQTITNIISELIYNGKKVLFVSEKKAALDVVKKNLDRVNLNDYALELHNYRENKKNFIEELYRTITKEKTELVDKAKENIDELTSITSNLNKYNNELNKIIEPINLSIFDILSNAYHYNNLEETNYVIDDVAKIGEKEFNDIILLLEQFKNTEKIIGYNYRTYPLYGLKIDNNSYSFKVNFKNLLMNDLSNSKELKELLNECNEKYNLKYNHAKELFDLFDYISFIHDNRFTDSLFKEDFENILYKINSLIIIKEEMDKFKNIIDQAYNEKIYEIDAKLYYDELSKYNSKIKRFFSHKYKKYIKNLYQLQKENELYDYNFIIKMLINVINYNEAKKEFDRIDNLGRYNFKIYQKYDTNFNDLISLINSLKININKYKDIDIKYDDSLVNKLNNIKKTYDENTNNLNIYFDNDIYNLDVLSIKNRINIISDIIDHFDDLDDYKAFYDIYIKIKDNNLLDFINKIISFNYPLSKLTDYYKASYYKEWADIVLNNNKELNSYNKFIHNKDISDFINKDKLELELAKAKIDLKLAKLRPNLSLQIANSPASVIVREHEKKRKYKPIRRILEEIPDFIQNIKPIFLMSPLSVSTLIPSDMEFDTVIFDEASQVFLEDAIVAIYRAKQLIVVGDSKQMPPTSFFLSQDYDMEYNEDDFDAYESILDLSSTIFPTRRLLCHYRSKNESLITFSNKNFYDNNLCYYPEAKSNDLGFGVDFIYVDKGIVDSKSKSNIVEASKVVDLIFDHFNNYPDRSLGVVAFNIQQMNMISNLLDKRRKENPSYDKFFNQDGSEPFFIKNLETVQGDERDTIIFSISYAKGENGQLALRFGPLSTEGGERRLNVAITRAKYNVKVVSSIKASDIDLTKVTNLGPKLLHDYLYYAENKNISNDIIVDNNDKSLFINDISKFLNDNGYDVSINYGESKYKVDIAVKNKNDNRYFLAIECNINNISSIRDKDRLKEEILLSKGWKYYRIYITDWYKNIDNEKKELLSYCKSSQVSDEFINKKINIDDYVETNKKDDEIYDIFVPYISKINGNVTDVTEDIVDKIGPISIDYLLKLISLPLFGTDKITKSTNSLFMQNLRSNRLLLEKGFIYDNKCKNYAMRLNVASEFGGIEYVSLYEIRNGMYQAIEYNNSCKKNELFDFIRTKLGLSRRTEKLNIKLEEAFKLLCQNIFVDIDGNISINEFNKLNIIRR